MSRKVYFCREVSRNASCNFLGNHVCFFWIACPLNYFGEFWWWSIKAFWPFRLSCKIWRRQSERTGKNCDGNWKWTFSNRFPYVSHWNINSFIGKRSQRAKSQIIYCRLSRSVTHWHHKLRWITCESVLSHVCAEGPFSFRVAFYLCRCMWKTGQFPYT